jgi:hypothetical protein
MTEWCWHLLERRNGKKRKKEEEEEVRAPTSTARGRAGTYSTGFMVNFYDARL